MKQNNVTEISAAALLVILGAGCLILWTAFWSGLVVSTLWGWFAVPLGIPSIGIAHAYGLVLLWSGFNMGKNRENEAKEGAFGRAVFFPPIQAGVIIGVSYIFHAWI